MKCFFFLFWLIDSFFLQVCSSVEKSFDRREKMFFVSLLCVSYVCLYSLWKLRAEVHHNLMLLFNFSVHKNMWKKNSGEIIFPCVQVKNHLRLKEMFIKFQLFFLSETKNLLSCVSSSTKQHINHHISWVFHIVFCCNPPLKTPILCEYWTQDLHIMRLTHCLLLQQGSSIGNLSLSPISFLNVCMLEHLLISWLIHISNLGFSLTLELTVEESGSVQVEEQKTTNVIPTWSCNTVMQSVSLVVNVCERMSVRYGARDSCCIV